jgi:hypothetical protein
MSGYEARFYLPPTADPSLKPVVEALKQFFARPVFESAMVRVLGGDWTAYVEVGEWEIRIDVDTQPEVAEEAREFATRIDDSEFRALVNGVTAQWRVSTAPDPEDVFYNWFAHTLDVIRGTQPDAMFVDGDDVEMPLS